MAYKEIVREKYIVEIEEPTLYVDNKSRKRSGHMSHAMAQFRPGCFIDFNSNCSAKRWRGHSPYGWIEYKISKDNGKTYSEIKTLPYSVECFLDGIHMISVEKAVATEDGKIVAFCLRNDGTDRNCCEPWDTPMVVVSADEGETWSEPVEISPYKGRVYDAFYKDGAIYVMQFCNNYFLGSAPEHLYRIYKSTDDGKTFKEQGIIPFDTKDRGYGTMLLDAKGLLHAYVYNKSDEDNLDHAVSEDMGKTWEVLKPCFVAKGARNPQTALIDGVYIMHCRAKDYSGFVVYASSDATNWDEGTLVVENQDALAFYSNNINLKDEKGNFLLIQFSDKYIDDPELFRTVDVKHMKLTIKSKC